ncbi:MAG: hypothetical protein KY476_00065 [Planctomycetes bacterium]|nr:hypothetical protein [Planctomycetota bacterium]
MEPRTVNFTLAVLLVMAAAVNWFGRDLWTTQHAIVPAASQPLTPDVERITLAGRRQDCGAKCLYLLCKLAGKPHGIDKLRELTNTTEDGTTMLDLKHAAERLSFNANGVELGFDALRRHVGQLGQYAILHSETEHFVPVVGAAGKLVRVLDPAVGMDDADERLLRSSRYRWKGNALLLTVRSGAVTER